MSGVMKSTPITSSPIARAVRLATSRLSGWITSVRSIDVPPVDRLPVPASMTISLWGGTLVSV